MEGPENERTVRSEAGMSGRLSGVVLGGVAGGVVSAEGD